jgi:rod shape-determining protein MreC
LRFLRRNKKLILLIFIITCIVLIFASSFLSFGFISDTFEFIVIPIEKFCNSSINWVGSKFYLVTNIFEIENENIQLKEKIEQYNLNEQRFKMIEAENKKLTNLINISQNYPNYEMTGAKVIAKDTSKLFNIFIIDKGLNDGLKNNMVVLDSNGVVGKITECRNNFSKVSSIIDDKSSLSIKNFRTDDLGFAKGDLKLKQDGLCQIEFLDAAAQIIEGDEIVTSNLSEIFPPGLLVGHVQKIESNSNTITAILEPVADLKHLENVLVITKVFDVQENFSMEE